MAQKVKVLATKPDDLSSILRTYLHGGKREPISKSRPLTSVHTVYTVVNIPTNLYNELIKLRKTRGNKMDH